MNTDASVLVALGMPSPDELIDGKWQVEKVIGEGAMGVVFRVVHVELDRPFAVKVVRDEFARNEEVVARMLQEARTAARLRSEHIAQVVDMGRLASGAPYIVMECLEGADLCSYLFDQGRLSSELAVSFVLQACEAVAEAHASGIIHRDLKPENLFLSTRADGSQLVKVLDFGISKNLEATGERAFTNPSSAVGTPHYMSPEQMRSGSDVDARADIWSLGAVLFELVTGQAPFDAETIPGVCAQVLGEPPTRPRTLNRSVPVELERIILKCLEKDPERRFGSVVELARELVLFGQLETLHYADRVARVANVPAQRTSPVPLVTRRISSSPTLPPRNRPLLSLAGTVVPNAPNPPGARRGGRWVSVVAGILAVGAGFAFARFGPPTRPWSFDGAWFDRTPPGAHAAGAAMVVAPQLESLPRAPVPSASPEAPGSTQATAPAKEPECADGAKDVPGSGPGRHCEPRRDR